MAPLELPLRVVHNRPFVQLDYHSGLSKRASVWTYLDTGGGAVLLGRRLHEELGLLSTGAPVQEDGGWLTPLAPPDVTAQGRPLSLDGCRVFGVEHDWIAPAAFDAPAFLPANFLRQHSVTFDYPGRTFCLDQPGILTGDTSLPADVHPETAFVRVELEIAGERLGFLLDTGASYSMISETVLETWRRRHPTWRSVTGAHGYAQMTGMAFEGGCRMVRVPEVGWGPLRLTDVGFVTRPTGVFEEYMSSRMTAPVVGALAGNVLRHLRVTLDYRHERMAVVPARTACGDDLHALGLTVRQTGGRCFVQAVAESAHEHTRREVRVGDEVLTAGETDLRDRSLTEIVEALCAQEGTALELRLNRNGEPQQQRLMTVALL